MTATKRFYTLKRGESLNEVIPVLDDSGSVVGVDGWTASGSQVVNSVDASLVGTTLDASGLTLSVISTDSTDEDNPLGYYMLNVFVHDPADEDNTKFHAANIIVQLTAATGAEIPINPQVIIEDLQLVDTFSFAQILRQIDRANDRAGFLVGSAFKNAATEKGWSRPVINWATELAMLYLRRKIYGSSEIIEAEIKEIESMLGDQELDTDGDGEPDIVSESSSSFSIERINA